MSMGNPSFMLKLNLRCSPCSAICFSVLHRAVARPARQFCEGSGSAAERSADQATVLLPCIEMRTPGGKGAWPSPSFSTHRRSSLEYRIVISSSVRLPASVVIHAEAWGASVNSSITNRIASVTDSKCRVSPPRGSVPGGGGVANQCTVAG